MNSNKLNAEHQTLQDTINNSRLINQLDLISLRNKFLNSKPFPHIYIDDMWNNNFLNKIALEVISFKNWAGEKDFFGSKKKRWQNNWDKLPYNTNKFLAYLNQSLFINIIEKSADNKFKISPEMMNLLGCSKENFYKLIDLMNYKKSKETDTYYFAGKNRANKERIVNIKNKTSPFSKLLALNIK